MFAANTVGASASTTYIEDVFSTYLYTGNGSTQTITNGIDLAGKGGMVWFKDRSDIKDHRLVDTARGVQKALYSNLTNAQATEATGLTAFGSTGFTLGANNSYNGPPDNYVSWTFRKAPKFFDVVTWTGNGLSSQAIPHGLGSAPGCVFIKATGLVQGWWVYHRSSGTGNYLVLNTTAAQTAGTIVSATTATDFTVGSTVTSSGQTYVAYVFAHDTATDGLIQCGSFTTDGSGNATVTLGWEPQFVLAKRTDAAQNWYMSDVMRGMPVGNVAQVVFPNLTNAEQTGFTFSPTPTGFTVGASTSGTYVYLAIRRGPMRPPTSGTQVYSAVARTGTGAAATVTGVGFPPDFVFSMNRNGASGTGTATYDRLRGATKYLNNNTTAAEGTDANTLTAFGMDGVSLGSDASINNINAVATYVMQFFRRYPQVFDIVCYTGTGIARTVSHNLGVAPELMIVKDRTSGVIPWYVLYPAFGMTAGTTNTMQLQSTAAASVNVWNYTAPTATAFTVNGNTNASGDNYVAYLFATKAGISKVGSYTGTGTTKQVDCGFAAGARFVLIKRTDSTGDWYVWDSTRGIIAGNDPYLLVNSTAAEATATDYIDPYSAGFELSSTAPAAINANGGTFVYLAFA